MTWILYVDGSCNHHGSKVGLVFTTLEQVRIEYALWFGFHASNNKAVYGALLVVEDCICTRCTEVGDLQ